MITFVSKIKSKTIEPSVYALVFDKSLTQVVAYSLEEAIETGLDRLKITDSIMPEMYSVLTMQDLKSSVLVFSGNKKTKLMEKIIASKDLELMQKHKKSFSVAELELLNSKINEANSATTEKTDR